MTINNDLFSNDEILTFEKKMILAKIKGIHKNQLMRKGRKKIVNYILHIIDRDSLSIDELNDFLIKNAETDKQSIAYDQTEIKKLQFRLNEILDLEKIKKEEEEDSDGNNEVWTNELSESA